MTPRGELTTEERVTIDVFEKSKRSVVFISTSERVRESGRSGAAALGLSEVAAALNVGRVAHLVYDPEVRYTGTVAPDGALYGDVEVGPGGHPGTPEPRLTERLVERALDTGARISPVEGAADGGLRAAAGRCRTRATS